MVSGDSKKLYEKEMNYEYITEYLLHFFIIIYIIHI
jgi:hypothetical protein